MNRKAKTIAATALGNSLECYDLILYGTFALTIGQEFFPHRDADTSLLIAFGTFGVSFFFRPLGGLMIGSFGDRTGRKAALLMTMFLMLLGTAMIAVTPSYASIGIIASVMVVLGRLIQGFSAGGEFASATAFLAEQSTNQRGFYASWQFASQGFSMLMAAAIGFLITTALTTEQVRHWGWRLSFLFGLLIGPALLFARSNLEETVEFQREALQGSPVREALAHQKANIAIALGTVIVATVGMYVMLYMPTYAVRQLQLTQRAGFGAAAVAGLTLFVLTPISGVLVDRYGRLIVGAPFAVLLLAVPIPLYEWLSHSRSIGSLCAAQILLAIPMAGYLGALGALLSDLFPVRSRTTGISLGYNLSVMLFGGFAPFIMTWLTVKTGSAAVPGYYLAAGATCSLVTIAFAWRRGYR
jgi:MHS family proline/betaine transporter-like MFS transporter